MKDYLADLRKMPHVERIRMLEANADQVKDGHYYRTFSPSEIDDMKEANTNNDLEILALEQQKARLIEPINERLKELKNTKKHTLLKIKEGREEVNGEYYVFNDDVEMKTHHISPSGDVIWEGPYVGYQKTITEEIRKTANG